MKKFSEEQIRFLREEIEKSGRFKNIDLLHLSPEEADELRDFCFDIEYMEANAHDPISARGNIAADIVDVLDEE